MEIKSTQTKDYLQVIEAPGCDIQQDPFQLLWNTAPPPPPDVKLNVEIPNYTKLTNK